MKKQIYFTILFIIFIACKKAPNKENIVQSEVENFDSNYLKSKTNYFIIKDDSISGSGKNVLKNIFKESEFVVFGERHNSTNTSKLIEVLIPEMNKNNFNTLCLEVGPHSALKLKELMQPPENTVDNLKQFNSKYYYDEIDAFPIPFFSGIEDAKFLKAASEYGMELWGLDQEYYYSILFLTDVLLKQNEQNPNFNEIKSLKQQSDSLIIKYFIEKNSSDKEIDVFASLLSEPIIIKFFDSIKSNENSSKIISDLKISWDIYSRWRKDSHADRISYMRNNFMQNYEEALSKKKSPKVFLKFGQLHASQIISKGTYDLGHFVNELATKNNVICTNINTWTRYYQEDDKDIDYLKDYPVHFGRYKSLMELAKENHWTIIDLKSIRNDISNQVVELPTNGDFHKLNSLIQGYDYQLILPKDKWIKENK